MSRIRTPQGPSPKDGRIECKAHLRFIRQQQCLVAASGGCWGRVEAHHVRRGSNVGMGATPGDDRAVPLCHRHHIAQFHGMGYWWFMNRYDNIDMTAHADRLWRDSPAGIKYRNMEGRG